MAILPARTAVLNYMNTVDEADVYQVMEALKSVYGKEKHYTVPVFLEDGKLSIRYKINEDGKQAVQKYIAK